MSKQLDLSDSSLLEIKLPSGVYKLRDLTKKEMEAYDENLKSDPLEAFDKLLTTMGMPAATVLTLGQGAKTKIMEALFEELSVKKK